MRTRSALLPSEENNREVKKESKEKSENNTSKEDSKTERKKIDEDSSANGIDSAMSPDPSRQKSLMNDVNNNAVVEEKNESLMLESPIKKIDEDETEAELDQNANKEEKEDEIISNKPNDGEVMSTAEKPSTDILGTEDKINNEMEDSTTVLLEPDDKEDQNAAEPSVDTKPQSTPSSGSNERQNKKKSDRKTTDSGGSSSDNDLSTNKAESDPENVPSSSSLSSSFPFSSTFPPNPASLLSNQLQSEFARSISAQFYNSLSLLASQAMMNVKQEPSDYPQYETSSLDNQSTSLPVPKRTDSRNSERSAHSSEGNFPNNRTSSPRRSYSPALSGGSESVVRRPLSGLSPKSLAEQLRNNDSASMVVSRQQKYPGMNAGYMKPYYPVSGDETPPPVFPTLNTSVNEPYPIGNDLINVSNGNMTSSPSLHHFTTRYTIETPADPSRLGVELVLDHDNEEPVIEVECGGNRGLLYINKLCQGSKGQSIHFNDEWLTPNEFQFISGRETAKDWKRSIRHCGKSLKTLMTKGILQVHPPVCECIQCRGLHGGSKLLPNKKQGQKDISSKKGKKSPLFGPDTKIPVDEMMRHGFEGGLSSIISQLHKANGFDTTDTQETLDLSTNSHHREMKSSPESRKRSRNESPEARKTKSTTENGHSSPSAKRPYSRQDDYNQYDGSSPFPTTYPFVSPEEQYRRMLALLNRSVSPGEQQRQLYNLAQNMDPLGLPTSNFNDYAALQNTLHFDSGYQNRDKGKYKTSRGRNEIMEGHTETGQAYDLTRKARDKSQENSGKRPDLGYGYGTGKNSENKYYKYRKSDRVTTPHLADSRHYRRPENTAGDAHKYIALESRSRDQVSTNDREDARVWSNKTPEISHRRNEHSMIDLNSNGSSSTSGKLPDWCPKTSWPLERDHMSRKQGDWRDFVPKSSPSRNRTDAYRGMYHDNHIVLDRIPINKTPVTTLHHRPPSKYPSENDSSYLSNDHHKFDHKPSHKQQNRHKPYHGNSSYQKNYRRSSDPPGNLNGPRTPMLDLKKHAIPVLSLTHSTSRQTSELKDKRLRPRLSNTSDQEMKDILDQQESSPIRQSSSAPPPHLSQHDSNSLKTRRPTSAQARTIAQTHPSLHLTSSPHTSPRLRDGFAYDVSNMTYASNATGESLLRHDGPEWNVGRILKQRSDEVQRALDDMHSWSVDDVCEFVGKIDSSFEGHLEEFQKHGIDGEGLPLLNERHLVDIMNFKLGHALKLVARVRRSLKIYPESITCCHHSLLSNSLLFDESSLSSRNVGPKVSEKSRNGIKSEHIQDDLDAKMQERNDDGELKIDEMR